MKFKFEKFGFVDKGELEVGDLTLICGSNNVGKTYVAYAIYCFIKDFKSLVGLSIFPDLSRQVQILKTEGVLTIDLRDYQDKLSEYLKMASAKFTPTIANYFSTDSDFFKNTKIEFLDDECCLDFSHEFTNTLKVGKEETLIIDKALDSEKLSIVLIVNGKIKVPNRILEGLISYEISNFLSSRMLPKPFVITSERTGIALFYKELDVHRNNIIDQLTEIDDNKFNPRTFLQEMNSRYALPIKDNIDIIRDAENLSKNKSFIRKDPQTYKYILEALETLIGGSFKTTKQQVIYQPKTEENREKVSVPIYIASSATKALYLLDLYINCIAEKNGLLVIDEPELNLHPDNQRKMASLLARLVNAGVKVLVTTHSDYLIRELNNRIMLSCEIDHKQEIMKQAKMVDEDILHPEQVKAFVLTHNHSIQQISIDKYGMNMELFDDLISEANALSDEIFNNMKEEEC
jgi:predicted ATP-dependent endonuclease of OLD family